MSLIRGPAFFAVAIALVLGAARAEPSLAQATGTVRGTVADRSTGRPLAGAEIGLAGTLLRVNADDQGRFTFPRIPAGQQTLRALMIGYARVEASTNILPGQETTLDFQLAAAAMQLDEVVVTGQPGRTEKRTLGNAVTTLKAADLTEAAVVVDVQDLLTGRTPGLTVIANSGQAGAGSNVRIRGAGSLAAGYEPVYYIDGVRFESRLQTGFGTGNSTVQATSPLSFLNPNDIESIEVVKGPAAATLYGADAAGGVIQIITKKGRRGAGVQWTVGGEAGESEWTKSIGNPVNYWLCKPLHIRTSSAASFPGCQGLDSLSPPEQRLFTHDPLREDSGTIRKGNAYRIDLSARGGGDFFNYYLSFDRSSEDGVFFNNFDRRTGGRANFDFTPNEKLDIGMNMSYSRTHTMQPLNDNASNGLLRNSLRGQTKVVAAPWQPGWRGFSPALTNAYDNQVRTERTILGLTATYRPLSWFSNRLTLGMDKQDLKNTNFFPIDTTGKAPWGAVSATGTISHFIPITHLWTADYAGTASFNLTSSLSSAFSAGMQLNARDRRSTSAFGEGLVASNLNLVGAAAVTRADETFTQQTSLGFYVQEQLGWRERLYGTFAVRVDDNSAFGKDFSLVVYPKASVSWVISEEPFFGGVPLVDQLKLRAAWGQAGNAPDPFSADRTMTVAQTTVNDQTVNQLVPSQYGNPNLKAETGSEYELGFDASLFSNKVGLEFTYYNKKTLDALIELDDPRSTGFDDEHLENVGEIANQGIEILLNTTPVSGRNLTWDATVSFSTNSNKLVSWGIERDEDTFGAFATVQKHIEGYPLGGFWYNDIQRDGCGSTDPDVATGCPTGNLIRDPNTIALVDINNYTYAGPSAPTREAAVTNTFTILGNLRLFAHMDYKGGYKVWCALCSIRNRIDQNTWEVNDPAVWQGWKTGDPLPEQVAIWRSLQTKTHIMDGDFLKLREVSVQYTLPTSWSRAFQANRVTFTLSGRNLGKWTKYKGTGDPEVNFAATSDYTRLDYASVPPMRQVYASVRMTF